MTNSVPVALLREYLSIDLSSPTGLLWRKQASSRALAGTPAFTSRDTPGYYKGRLNGRTYRAHRVVYFLTHGVWPQVVDHLDGCRTNNAPANLVNGTTQTNNHNRVAKGYYQHMRGGGWYARIRINGKSKSLGTFRTEAEARRAYLTAKAHYHPTAPSRCFIE